MSAVARLTMEGCSLMSDDVVDEADSVCTPGNNSIPGLVWNAKLVCFVVFIMAVGQ